MGHLFSAFPFPNGTAFGLSFRQMLCHTHHFGSISSILFFTPQGWCWRCRIWSCMPKVWVWQGSTEWPNVASSLTLNSILLVAKVLMSFYAIHIDSVISVSSHWGLENFSGVQNCLFWVYCYVGLVLFFMCYIMYTETHVYHFCLLTQFSCSVPCPQHLIVCRGLGSWETQISFFTRS